MGIHVVGHFGGHACALLALIVPRVLHFRVHSLTYVDDMCMLNHVTSCGFPGRGSRALRDGNWRSPTTPDDDPTPGWGNQRQQPPSPGAAYTSLSLSLS